MRLGGSLPIEEHCVLLAGVGNIFMGDDAFGVRLVHEVVRHELPAGVIVRDFGTRGFDLAYALESATAAIIVDATRRGGPPGTLYVIEPSLDELTSGVAPDLHRMTPDSVFAWLKKEQLPKRLRLVGCEPATFGPPEGQLGMSASVSSSVTRGIPIVMNELRKMLVEIELEDDG